MMTATTARAQVHGLDRFVMKLSLAMLLWARKRADRATLSRDQHARLIAQSIETQRREREFALRGSRVI